MAYSEVEIDRNVEKRVATVVIETNAVGYLYVFGTGRVRLEINSIISDGVNDIKLT